MDFLRLSQTRYIYSFFSSEIVYPALRYAYLDLGAVTADLAARHDDLHVVVTGRNAKPELLEIADLVTEMTLVKHHFGNGVKAQAGVEF